MTDYLIKAAGAWFVGFFPLAEIYVAIPAAVAAGLDNVSVIVWTVFGNFTPVLLINFLYEWLIRYERVRKWLEGLVSEKVKARINRWGTWFVLLVTPWTGVWVMSVTAKALGMNSQRFLVASFISILVYAIVLLLMLRLGIASFG
ncbi:MAG: hypothetical protein OHK0046_27950 [Anaerolineae bacterium]